MPKKLVSSIWYRVYRNTIEDHLFIRNTKYNIQPTNTQRGFTLVELLVTISIIAILSTIGIVVYTNARKSALDGKRMGDVKQIQNALEQYYSFNQSYPSNLGGIPANQFETGTAPTDPTTAEGYNYKKCSTDEKYILCTGTLDVTKGNRSSLPDDPAACSGAVTNGGNAYYCVGSLSN